MLSALSVPQATDDLGRLIEDNWAMLDNATSREVLTAFRAIGQLQDFAKYTDEQVWNGSSKSGQEPATRNRA